MTAKKTPPTLPAKWHLHRAKLGGFYALSGKLTLLISSCRPRGGGFHGRLTWNDGHYRSVAINWAPTRRKAIETLEKMAVEAGVALPRPAPEPNADRVRTLGARLREAYQQATWEASGLPSSYQEAEAMAWDAVAREALQATGE